MDTAFFVDLLKKSVGAWNKWREDNPKVTPNLSDADLKDRNLSNANLEGVSFSNADLSQSNFRGANLKKANLTGADLSFSNFERCNIDNADFTNTILASTKFLDVDLDRALNLDTIDSKGISYIDNLTFIKSKGNISIEFLKRIGTPDEVVEYVLPIFKDKVINYYTGFISYSTLDEKFARRLYNDLRGANVQVWYAHQDLKIGDRLMKINQEIRLRDKLILILSKNSINSNWVENEVETALAEEVATGKTILFPIRIDDDVKSSEKWWAMDIWRKRLIGDFSKWEDHDIYLTAFEKLLKDLKEG